MKKTARVLCIVLAVLLVCLAVLVAAFFIVRQKGKQQIVTPGVKPSLPSFPFDDEEETDDPLPALTSDEPSVFDPQTTGYPDTTSEPDISVQTPTTSAAVPDTQTTPAPETTTRKPQTAQTTATALPADADVYYKGKAYNYDDSRVNILFIGVDKLSDEGGEHQADALFLVSLSETAKTVRIIGISRNTITYISKLNAFGQLVTKTETQICLAYGFGATEERRSELAAEAVSNLFYGLPIQGYYTLYMDEIAEIVDYLGGVEVQITEDVAGLKPGWEVGKKVALGGAEMLTYLRTRDLNQSGSNELRFKRQQLFISSLFSAAKAKFKSDSTMPLTLFTRLSGRSTTNVSLESAVYLSTVALKSSFDSVQSVKGNLGTLFDRDALFVDEKALYELIIKNFYIQIS